MTCPETEPLLGASLDGELDPQTALSLDAHVAGCAACSAVLGKLERLRDELAAADLDYSATADLRPLAAKIRRQHRGPWWTLPWLRPAVLSVAAIALVVALTLPGRVQWTAGSSAERQVIDSHIRSMLAQHLVDVPSSDRHTVKPWFQGKLDFAPAVPDLTSDGFELIGGRLDVIEGRPAAAIVYKRRSHIVNLWISSVGGSSERPPELTTRDGFHVLSWRRERMQYWVVSDLNVDELREFTNLVRSR